ncbi:MAG: SPOR domain-containing protein [Candidatus Eisenbacteria bacterium]|nr:SPOR domain-containing protein [Candidatus Eisenbacteria bacterium]
MSSRGRVCGGAGGAALPAALVLLSALTLFFAAGCTRAPRPAAAITAAPVFPITGDTSEVLATIPDPATRPRPAAPLEPESGDATELSADPAPESPELPDSAVSPNGQGSDVRPDARPDAPGTPSGHASAPSSAPAPPEGQGTLWVVQVFAGGDRAAAYREAQRAARELKLGDDEMTMSQDGRMWKVRIGSPGPREPAQALLERARRAFPRAFLLPLPPGGGDFR